MFHKKSERNMSKLSKFLTIELIITMIIFISPFSPPTSFSMQLELDSSTAFDLKVDLLYTVHAPITILSDQNFTDYGFPGTGTEGDPYRIENFLINTTQESAIAVQQTSQHFIIQNCLVTGERYGIFIYNTTYSKPRIESNICTASIFGIYIDAAHFTTITNNTCTNNSGEGIRVSSSVEPTITDNICINNEDGIDIVLSSRATIENNTCEKNEIVGLSIRNTDPKKASKNRCINNKYGLRCILIFGNISDNYCADNEMYGIGIQGSHVTLFNNTCYGNKYGIYNFASFFAETINNTCEKNDYGIFFTSGSWHNTISNNTVINNNFDGIYLELSKDCLITYNRLEENKGYGVYIKRSTNLTLVAYNSFINNNPDGSSQGYDAGFDNIWYDKKAKKGNYWSEWVSDNGSYTIDGRAEAKDRYPLDANLQRINSISSYWGFMSLIVLPVIAISTLFFYKKKRR